jgi:hypothetical protein
MVPAVSLNYGQAAILTPSDFPFSHSPRAIPTRK